MAFDPIKLRILAEKKADENWNFRQFLKQHADDDLDEQVTEVTKRVWAGIDCAACANCCKNVRPTLSDEDIDRLSSRLGISRERIIEAYLEKTEPGEDNPWRTRMTPCPFLRDNRCSVYEDRPEDCRGYPYLYEPDLVFRMTSMIDRTFTCPIVYEAIEELKPVVGFQPGKNRR
jgi:Fe-S-cluster containining protein